MSESNTRAEIVEVMANEIEDECTMYGAAVDPALAKRAASRALTALEASGRAVVPRALVERVIRIREWNHDEYGDACREYDSAADDLAATLPPSKE